MSTSEPPTPSQAEGERDGEETGQQFPHPTPSQAEGDRDDEITGADGIQ